MDTDTKSPQNQQSDVRDAKAAMWCGWRRTCPNCGTGPLFSSFLTVRDSCPVCRQDLFHQRADDGPAYLTILIVGHIIAPTFLFVFIKWRLEPLVLFTIFSVLAVAMSLYLLPRLKGAIIGLQWARYMHGFNLEASNLDGSKSPLTSASSVENTKA